MVCRGRTLSHRDRAQIRALFGAGYNRKEIGDFYGCGKGSLLRAKTNELEGKDKGDPESDWKLLDKEFLELVEGKDLIKLKRYIVASVEEQEAGKHGGEGPEPKPKSKKAQKKALTTSRAKRPRAQIDFSDSDDAYDPANTDGHSPVARTVATKQSTTRQSPRKRLRVSSGSESEPLKQEHPEEEKPNVKLEGHTEPSSSTKPYSQNNQSHDPSLSRSPTATKDDTLARFLTEIHPPLVSFIAGFRQVGLNNEEDLRTLRFMTSSRKAMLDDLRKASGMSILQTHIFVQALEERFSHAWD